MDLNTGWAQLRLRDQEKRPKRQGQGAVMRSLVFIWNQGLPRSGGSFHKLTLLACALISVEALQFLLQEVGGEGRGSTLHSKV